MKHLNLFPLFFVLFLFTSCKKDKDNPGPFAGTTYKILGTYNDAGKPNYLAGQDNISPGLQEFINNYFADGRYMPNTNPELFTNPEIGDITVTRPSTIYVTYVYQNAGTKNAIAFYTYPTNSPPATAKDIEVITYVFPNAGNGTPLVPGDKVKIGEFNAGTSIGFVLLSNAWKTQSKSLDDNAVHYCTNDVLNPEKDPALKKHAVLIKYPTENKVLIGFEDMDRERPECDNDFNDSVIYCTVVS